MNEARRQTYEIQIQRIFNIRSISRHTHRLLRSWSDICGCISPSSVQPMVQCTSIFPAYVYCFWLYRTVCVLRLPLTSLRKAAISSRLFCLLHDIIYGWYDVAIYLLIVERFFSLE